VLTFYYVVALLKLQFNLKITLPGSVRDTRLCPSGHLWSVHLNPLIMDTTFPRTPKTLIKRSAIQRFSITANPTMGSLYGLCFLVFKHTIAVKIESLNTIVSILTFLELYSLCREKYLRIV